MRPILYQYTACPFCSKVATMLAYKNVSYDIVEVNPLTKRELKFSAYKKVPIYRDSQGAQVNDPTNIMRHIDKEFPSPLVFRVYGAEKDREERWLAWSETYVQGLPTALYDTLPHALQSFDYVTRVAAFPWVQRRIIKYAGALIMTAMTKKIARRRQIDRPAEFLQCKTDEWSQGLQGNSFMGGKEPNAADLAVYGISRVATSLAAGDIFRRNTTFMDWLARMERKTHLPMSIG